MKPSLFSRIAKQVNCSDDDLEWINQITECPVYNPSIHDFQDPILYIQKIAPHASKFGIFIFFYIHYFVLLLCTLITNEYARLKLN